MFNVTGNEFCVTGLFTLANLVSGCSQERKSGDRWRIVVAVTDWPAATNTVKTLAKVSALVNDDKTRSSYGWQVS